MPPRSTIVIPCFNEAARLDARAMLEFAAARRENRFLMVNDGSGDATLDVLHRLRQAAPEAFEVLDLGTNQGKAEAVRRGVLQAAQAGGELIGYWDADLATPLDELPRFWDVLDHCPRVQLVLGARVRLLGTEISRRPWRHLLGRVFATAASLALRLPVYDTQCGAKVFRATPIMLGLFGRPFRNRWAFDVEILARLIAAHDPAGGASASECVHELPLRRWDDMAGSKVRLRQMLGAALSLAAVAREVRRPRHSAPAAIPFAAAAPQPRRAA